ncbi:MAG TPA: ABC transporter permease [Actinomadura sp.]|jgi:NitT/TauT family transport system permease protein|nr:ABC transporter permease [Actinomadura sp.]
MATERMKATTGDTANTADTDLRDRDGAPKPPVNRHITGLDALELTAASHRNPLAAIWSVLWPVLAAVTIAVGIWQAVVLSGWKESWVLPGPADVLPKLAGSITSGTFWGAVGLTMQRALIGFALSVLVGVVLGVVISRFGVLRRAFGSLITGLQTMPSIAWFPLAILLFQLSESAILFVVVLGAAPSIANGLIAGVDYLPPILLRAGKVMGLRGVSLYRHLIMPASLPAFVAGLKQGWAFAWRSLMAGELLVQIGTTSSVGRLLSDARELNDTAAMISVMIVILVIGIVIDQLFGLADRTLRARRGLTGRN